MLTGIWAVKPMGTLALVRSGTGSAGGLGAGIALPWLACPGAPRPSSARRPRCAPSTANANGSVRSALAVLAALKALSSTYNIYSTEGT